MDDRLVLGIDPGLTGALAVFDPARPGAVVVHDMPVAGGMVDAAELARLVCEIGPTEAVVEQVASRPGQGVASIFKFGTCYGAALATVAAMGIPARLVPPTRWKKHFRLGADKEDARALAVRLWPGCPAFSRKKDHGRAEAALIARFGAEVAR